MSLASTMSLPVATGRIVRPLLQLSQPVRSAEPEPAVRRVSSQSLLDGGRELVIQHEGSEYHLRLTRNDKLILTK